MPFERTCSSITSVIGCNILLTTYCIPLSLIHSCILISHFFSAYISLPSSFPGVFPHTFRFTHMHTFSLLCLLLFSPILPFPLSGETFTSFHPLPFYQSFCCFQPHFLNITYLLACPWFVIRIQWKYHLIQSHTPSPQPPTRTSTQHPFLSFQSVIVS